MTLEPQPSKVVPEQSNPDFSKTSILEDMFYLGYTKSEKVVVYRDESKEVEINAVFRTITPAELREIYEASGRYETVGGQAITEKLETLARAIVTINEMPLILDTNDREKFKKEYGRDPDVLEQAKIILIEKLKSPELLDMLYESYREFAKTITEQFNDIKKKLKNPMFSN